MKNWKKLFLNVSLISMILLSACSNGDVESPSDEMKGEMNANEDMEMDSNDDMNSEEMEDK